ncbi:MAG: dephospho-CoA kinase [Bryobacteraceae bacterium]
MSTGARIYKVGLTGGLASGKTFVGEVLEQLGCHLIHADELGHRALAPDGGAYAAAVAEFGNGILRDDGTIDRRRLGAIVFSDPGRLALLNSLVHPEVFRREQELLQEIERADPGAIAVVEAAIMIEGGSYKRYDKLIVAACPREIQIARAMKRDQLSREDVEQRLARQMPLAEKIRFADFVIDTSGSKEETRASVRPVYDALRALANNGVAS